MAFRGPFRFRWLATAVLLWVVGARAQAPGGVIGVFADSAGAHCDLLVPPGTSVVTLYVVHWTWAGSGLQGCDFAIDDRELLPSTVLRTFDGSWPDAQGDPFDLDPTSPLAGLSVRYGDSTACFFEPVVVGRITYFLLAPPPACAAVRVVAHPRLGGLFGLDCQRNPREAWGVTSRINDDGSCPCRNPQRAASSSWGRIKALYE